MTPTLVILAAGMGSRYGGLKQIEAFGPSGETLMDYGIYDAATAGFGKIVFVIRHDFEADFRKVVGSKYERRLPVEYAFQELDDLPPGFSLRADRRKPWGTAHAIWCARRCVKEPFASVNADDCYGKNAYQVVAGHLRRDTARQSLPEYCVVGYPILRTLSDHGAVARGLCEVDDQHNDQQYLRSLVECKQVEKFENTARYLDEAGSMRVLRGDEVVSMNMFGFTPAVFEQIERHLIRFLEVQRQKPDNSECLIPEVVNQIVKEKAARVRVCPTSASWFGVTYPQDKAGTMQFLQELVERGEYPSPIGKGV